MNLCDMDADTAKAKFRELIDWMKGIAKEKMKSKEGRAWLNREWGVKCEPWNDEIDGNQDK